MFELLYTSISPVGLSESDLIKILEKARLKNKRLGITGMLIYHDREIMQILEGEKSKVEELFQTIFEDDRHRSIDKFFQGEIETRAFSEWSMAFKSLDDNLARAMVIDGYEEFSKDISPISMMKTSQNRGKRAFLYLRDRL